MDKQIPVKTDPIRAVAGGDFLTQLLFQDGSAEELEGLFVAYGSASSVDFARKLGVRIENGSIVVDQNQKTNVSGVFAAGDCTGGLAQVSVAVGQGAVAGEQAKRYVKALQDG
jgi:thioredoxin reductase (NADPH)